MYNTNGLTPHDALELNEVMIGGMTTLKMMEANLTMVQDPDLKEIMQNCLEAKKNRMQEMQQFTTNIGGTSQFR